MTLQIYEKFHKKNPVPRDSWKVHCSHTNLITDKNAGEVICPKCGQVVNERMEDGGIEYSTNSFEEYLKINRIGIRSTLSIHDRGLSTTIDKQNIDFVGRKLKNKTIKEFHRLRIWDSRSKYDTVKRNMVNALSILEGVKNKLALTDTISESAAYIYRKAALKRLARGRGIREIIGASIYIACRQESVPRSLLEIAKTSNIAKGDLARVYRVLVNELDLKLQAYNPIEFLTKICNNTGMSEKTKRYAQSLLIQAGKKRLFAGRNPLVICAAAAYIASLKNGEPKLQDKLAEVAGVTNVALRNNVSFLIKQLMIDC